jgi:hypothetical protein
MSEKQMKSGQEMLNCWEQEKREIRQLRTKQLRAQSLNRVQWSKLISECIQALQVHIATYREELTKFFTAHPQPILAFDGEEIYNKTICYLGVKLNPDLSVWVEPVLLSGPPGDQQISKMMDKLLVWIRKEGKEIPVCIHGSNAQELRILERLSNPQVNTESVLTIAKEKKIKPFPPSPSLYEFEKMIGFQRQYCVFMKHAKLDIEGVERKHFAKILPDQSMISLGLRSADLPQHTCCLCSRPQDVLLYCLEDTFITLLIYAFYFNRNLRLT